MCRKYAHAMPAIGVCLLCAQGGACSWVPPATRIAQADTTALGTITELLPTSLWPGESRRIALPPVVSRPGTHLQYEIRGDRGIAFSLKDELSPFTPIVRGVILAAERRGSEALPSPSPAPAPPPDMGPILPEATQTPNLTAPSYCVVRTDTLAMPGDTISLWYTISTVTQPPRKSVWRVRIVVAAPPALRAASSTPIDGLTVYPNPCNPSTTVSFRVARPATVTLTVFDAAGRMVARFDRGVAGYKAQSITWNGTDGHGRSVASGVYLIRVQSGDEVRTRKVILLK